MIRHKKWTNIKIQYNSNITSKQKKQQHNYFASTLPAPASTLPAPASTLPAPASTLPAPASTLPAPAREGCWREGSRWMDIVYEGYNNGMYRQYVRTVKPDLEGATWLYSQYTICSELLRTR